MLFCSKNVFGGDLISNILLFNRENTKISPFKVLHQSSKYEHDLIGSLRVEQKDFYLTQFLGFYRTRNKHHIHPIVLTVSGGVNGTCFVNEKNNGKGIFLRLLIFYLKPSTSSLLVQFSKFLQLPANSSLSYLEIRQTNSPERKADSSATLLHLRDVNS